MRLLYLPAYYEPEKYSGLYINKDIIKAYLEENKNNEIIIYTPIPTRGVTKQTREEYKKRKKEEFYEGRLKIYRYLLWEEKNHALQRGIRYIFQGIIQIISSMKVKNIDIIMMSSTPPTNGIVGTIIKRIKKTFFIYNLQDIFPESLVNTKIVDKKSVLYKIGEIIEKITYRNADIIHVPSIDLKTNIMKKDVPEDKVKVIYNWVDEQKIKPIKKEENTIFEELDIDKKKFYVVYAGNIGKAQNIEMVLRVAKELEENTKIQFLIFGEGLEKENIIQMLNKEEISNVKVFPLQPYEKVANVYSMSDISIVICKKGFGQVSIPSKTWSIMATGTPILASFDKGTELQKIIEENQIGIFTEAEELEELKQAIIKFYEDKTFTNQCGKNARNYIEKNLTKNICSQKYIQSMRFLDNGTVKNNKI